MNKKGFSLLEVLIGLIILAVGLLAIAALQTTSVRGNFFSHNLIQATYIAQDRLEALINIPFNQFIQLSEGSHPEGLLTISGVTFHRAYTLSSNGDLRIINYTVAWNDGVDHRISFSTARSQ